MKEMNEYVTKSQTKAQNELSDHQNTTKVWQDERQMFEESIAKLDELVGLEFYPKNPRFYPKKPT